MSELDTALAELVSAWLPANDDPDRPLMQLATVDADGRPDVRSVLLSEWDMGGFFFHTDSRSRKVAQLTGSPWCALALVLDEKRRQLVIRGPAKSLDAADLARAYAARSPFLRQLAWVNDNDTAVLDLGERQRIWAEFSAQRPDVADHPETWVGFRVDPCSLTFWEAGMDAASRRTEYTCTGGAWTHHFLPG